MNNAYHIHIFTTPIGPCGIAWRGKWVVAVQFPEATPSKTAAKLAARVRTHGAIAMSPPAWVQKVIRQITASLEGKPVDFTSIPIDADSLPAFHRLVYVAARTIPAGRTVTYGELAAMAGSPGAARAVGQALARNPFPLIVPCHRVVAASNKLGGFTAHRGQQLKTRLLALEDITY